MYTLAVTANHYTVWKGKPLIFYNLLLTCFGHRSLGIAP